MSSQECISLPDIDELRIDRDDVGVDVVQETTAHRTCFLDLPRELRDDIYQMVLLQDLPIELAPITGRRYTDFWDVEGEEFEEFPYFYEHYQQDIRPTLSLLCASKQINEEAAAVYYGQPFRFSNQAGWWILAHWLDAIGQRHRVHVKDVTICHPSWADSPPQKYHANRLLYHQFLEPLGLPTMRDLGGEDYLHEWRFGWLGADPGEMKSISSMPNLRSLQLVLHRPYSGFADTSLWYERLVEHPLHANTTTPPTEAKVSIINLVEIHRALDSYDLTLEDVIDGPSQQRQSARMRFANWDEQWTEYYDAAVRTFSELRTRGVNLEEMRYDYHDHYPVEPNQKCVNKGYCEYIKRVWAGWYVGPDGESNWPPCPGT